MTNLASRSVVASMLIASVACAPPPEGDMPDLGAESVQLALTAIPGGTSCVRFTTVAGGRSFAQDFNVTAMTMLTAQVRGLPANQALTISADAYAVACTAITPTTQATWVSAPVAVTLTPGVIPTVSFVLRPAGGVAGDVDFLFLASTPASKAFASTVVGQVSATLTFTVQNIGPAATGLPAVSLVGAAANQFAIVTNGCTAALAANATCTLQARFAPTTAGAKTATLQVAATPGGTLPIALTGTGVQAAVLALTPATQDFGTVGVGRSSPPVTYTVSNTGGTTTTPVALTSSDATFAVSGSTCDVLTQNQTCTFKVTFSPTAIASKSATLTATAGTVTAAATVTGNGVAAPALTLTPNVLDFGSVVVGEAKQLNVTVKNTSGFTLGPISAFAGGTSDLVPFVVNAFPCSFVGMLAPGASCVVPVTASSSIDLGPQLYPLAGTLLVTAGGANPTSVMGTASVTISWPMVSNPIVASFGQVKTGTSATKTIRFTNVGTKSVGPVTTLGVSGNAAFTLVSDGCTTSAKYAPAAFCDVTVRFAPTASQAYTGTASLQLPNLLEGVGLNGSGIF